MRPSDLRREQPGASKAAPPDHGQTLGARSTWLNIEHVREL